MANNIIEQGIIHIPETVQPVVDKNRRVMTIPGDFCIGPVNETGIKAPVGQIKAYGETYPVRTMSITDIHRDGTKSERTIFTITDKGRRFPNIQ